MRVLARQAGDVTIANNRAGCHITRQFARVHCDLTRILLLIWRACLIIVDSC